MRFCKDKLHARISLPMGPRKLSDQSPCQDSRYSRSWQFFLARKDQLSDADMRPVAHAFQCQTMMSIIYTLGARCNGQLKPAAAQLCLSLHALHIYVHCIYICTCIYIHVCAYCAVHCMQAGIVQSTCLDLWHRQLALQCCAAGSNCSEVTFITSSLTSTSESAAPLPVLWQLQSLLPS